MVHPVCCTVTSSNQILAKQLLIWYFLVKCWNCVCGCPRTVWWRPIASFEAVSPRLSSHDPPPLGSAAPVMSSPFLSNPQAPDPASAGGRNGVRRSLSPLARCRVSPLPPRLGPKCTPRQLIPRVSLTETYSVSGGKKGDKMDAKGLLQNTSSPLSLSSLRSAAAHSSSIVSSSTLKPSVTTSSKSASSPKPVPAPKPSSLTKGAPLPCVSLSSLRSPESSSRQEEEDVPPKHSRRLIRGKRKQTVVNKVSGCWSSSGRKAVLVWKQASTLFL